MSEQREVTRQHYDLHAQQQQHLPTHLALKQRREGPAAPLKKFHNEIKRRLIYRFGYQAEALIDYACGRGGDIHKWNAAKVAYVKGLDISQAEIEEAGRRFKELQDETQQRGAVPRLQADFEQTDTLGQHVHEEQRQYDVATCMFAMHYFFDKVDSLRTLLQTITTNLKPGGYFIGCVPDGKRIKAQLVKREGKLEAPHLVLKSVSGDYKPFGSSYIMEIPDTVVEGHEGLTEGSHEYVVFDKVLLAEAAKAGLHPVLHYGDPVVDALFEPSDVDKPMKHFHPQYPETTDSSLAMASELYMAFVLQKVDSPQSASAPRVPPREQRDGGGRGGGPAGGRGGGGGRQQRQGGRGGGNRLDSLEWNLPYAATSLRPEDLPSVYFNVRHSNLQLRQQEKGRWIIYPPPLPAYSGPVQFVDDMHHGLQPVHLRLPDGNIIHDYYAELNYHARQQELEQQAQGFQPQQHPQQQQDNHHHHLPHQQQQGASNRPSSSSHAQQQQQQPGLTLPDPPGAAAGGGRGGRGRGRGRGPKAAAGGAADGGPDAAAGAGRGGATTRGRGRGSRGGRVAGGKRDRPPDDVDGLKAGVVAAEGNNGQPADDGHEPPTAKKQAMEAAAAAVVAAVDAGEGPDHAPAAEGAAAGGAAGGQRQDQAPAPAAPHPTISPAERLLRIMTADPMGYKDREVPVDLPQELLAELLQHAPPYALE